MKYVAILFLLLCQQLPAQTFVPDLQNRNVWELHGRDAKNLTDNSKNGVSFWFDEPVAVLQLKDYDFSEGTIEFDVRGRDELQRCFVGIAFHIQNDSTYDVVYFRPFNFKNAEVFRRLRSVQYISWPKYTWQKLRAEHPNQYEHPVTPVPEPDEWFHAKMVILGKTISVYVNDSAEPSLVVEKLTDTTHGGLGLWVGDPTEADFANLKITPAKK
ncbi:MAG: hypothetical protein JNM22_20100 [Saprospiraceae bacterium]|nr:hypothetical protein [Saprospiraceae bacterium]